VAAEIVGERGRGQVVDGGGGEGTMAWGGLRASRRGRERGRGDGGVVGASDGGGAAGVPVTVGEAGGGLASVAERGASTARACRDRV
jgi:hypothetical protein